MYSPTAVRTGNKRFQFQVVILHLLELFLFDGTARGTHLKTALPNRYNRDSADRTFGSVCTYVWGCVGSSPNVTVSPGMSLKHFWQKVYLSEIRPYAFRLLYQLHCIRRVISSQCHACVLHCVRVRWTTANFYSSHRTYQSFKRQFREVRLYAYIYSIFFFRSYTCMQWYCQLIVSNPISVSFPKGHAKTSFSFFQLAFCINRTFRNYRFFFYSFFVL